MRNNYNEILGVDVDGVILNTHQNWLDIYNQRHRTNHYLNDLTKELCNKIMPTSSKEAWDIFDSIPDTKIPLVDVDCPRILMELMFEHGYAVEVITARHVRDEDKPWETHQSLMNRLEQLRVPYDLITFTNPFDKTAKQRVVKADGVDWLVEDSVSNLESIALYCHPLLYVRPWNHAANPEWLYSKVYDWSDVYQLLTGREW